MASKSELLSKIVGELLESQSPERATTPFRPEFPLDWPPQLALGNGRWLPFSKSGLGYIREFASVLIANDRQLAISHSRSEVSKIVERAFAVSFASIDVDLDRHEIDAQIDERVRAELDAAFGSALALREITLGCWALTGAGTEDLLIGPIRIVDRNLWLQRMEESQRVSHIAGRRIRSVWQGNAVRQRRPSIDQTWERAILDSVGDCNTVCTVSTVGLSPEVAKQKGQIAARLALTTLALFWRTPSKALERMGLLYDGPLYRRHSIALSERGPTGSGTQWSGIKGHFVTDEWRENWKTRDWLITPVGEAIATYVQPSKISMRPSVSKAILQALSWFQAACIERSQSLAIVKFAACLDALVGGNEENGIVQLIKARMNIAPDDKLTTDGKTLKQAVAKIYKARSLAIHGTNPFFSQDLGEERALAESVAAISFRACCNWLHENPSCDDLAELRR